jgi:hypothetical protein
LLRERRARCRPSASGAERPARLSGFVSFHPGPRAWSVSPTGQPRGVLHGKIAGRRAVWSLRQEKQWAGSQFSFGTLRKNTTLYEAVVYGTIFHAFLESRSVIKRFD